MISAQLEPRPVDQLRSVLGRKWSTYPDCIGAFIAEMDFATAPVVQDALREIVDAGFFGYMPESWMTDMQRACAGWYERQTGWTIAPERIRALPDVLKGFEETVTHFTRPGSKVIVPTPAYMPFLTFPGKLGRELIEVPSLFVDGRWELDYDGIDAAFADGGGMLTLCNPWNPVGRVLTRDEMVRVSEIVDRHAGRVFSDEIHAPLTYPGHPHVPYASVSDVTASHTVTAVSASKAFNLPGLKCAQLILSNEADAEHWKTVGFFAEHGAAALGVVANTVAYSEGQEWLDSVRNYLDGNRKLLADRIQERLPKVKYAVPEGTYLAWLDFSAYELPDDIGTFLREKANVAITDGGACGKVGKGNVRFNFAMASELVEQAVDQIANVVVG